VELARQRAYVPVRGHKKKSAKKGKQTEITEMAERKKVIRIDETITVAELSQTMGVKSADLIRKLIAGGKMVTQNQPIDFDTASLLAIENGWKVEKVGVRARRVHPRDRGPSRKTSGAPPPVVTIMGHVDITARPRCSTPSARPTWRRAKPAGNHAAHRRVLGRRHRLRWRGGVPSPSSIRRATSVHRHARAGRQRHDNRRCWWSPPTTA